MGTAIKIDYYILIIILIVQVKHLENKVTYNLQERMNSLKMVKNWDRNMSE
jgi:hypothetical protein